MRLAPIKKIYFSMNAKTALVKFLILASLIILFNVSTYKAMNYVSLLAKHTVYCYK